jgi:L-asparaginase
MLKILVVLTGGTIGSKIGAEVIDVNKTSTYYLIQSYEEKYGKEIEFEIINPITMLSENFTPKEWEILYNALSKIKVNHYDGIIIAHGSDTLSYTSALVGVLFSHLSIPMVIIASNYPLEDLRSNGISNLRSAISFIANKKVRGVYTIFQNNLGENIVYLATRIEESDSYNDQFTCYGGEVFGKIVEQELVLNEHVQNPTLTQLNQGRNQILKNRLQFEHNVLVLKSYPGLNYDFFDFHEKPRVILHCLYHSATACIKKGPYSLIDFIHKCIEQGIDFYVISFNGYEQKRYATSEEILKSGAIPMVNISVEAAYAKLLIGYNQKEMEPKDYIKENIYFEFLPVK